MNNIIYYLKPEGKLCINHMYKENLESVWYFNIHEKAAIKHFSRFPPRDLLKKVLLESGFVNYKEVKCYEPLIGIKYYDATFPLY